TRQPRDFRGQLKATTLPPAGPRTGSLLSLCFAWGRADDTLRRKGPTTRSSAVTPVQHLTLNSAQPSSGHSSDQAAFVLGYFKLSSSSASLRGRLTPGALWSPPLSSSAPIRWLPNARAPPADPPVG
ncbi:hypothetical protein H1C71_011802, partial [Ictidomys tridecemlineatus]